MKKVLQELPERYKFDAGDQKVFAGAGVYC